LIGRSDRQHLVVVAHVERGAVIRIVSARPASRRERNTYEEDQQSPEANPARRANASGIRFCEGHPRQVCEALRAGHESRPPGAGRGRGISDSRSRQ